WSAPAHSPAGRRSAAPTSDRAPTGAAPNRSAQAAQAWPACALRSPRCADEDPAQPRSLSDLVGVSGVRGWEDGCAVSAGEVPLAVAAFDGDLAPVDVVVVGPAQQDAVADGGGAVVFGPPEGVVDLPEFGWLVAAGVLAMSVSGDDGLGLVRGEDP